MNAKDFIVHNSCYWQIIEQISKITPAVQVTIFSHYFLVETIHHRNLPAFMITSKQCHFGWIFQFKTQEIRQGFHRVVPTIHKIPYKDIAIFRQWTALSEEL